jgi:hypothetical protein
MQLSEKITYEPMLRKFPNSVKGNSHNEFGKHLGFIPQMETTQEITRETQLARIDEGLKRLGTNAHAFEKKAGLNPGSINDLRRGKRPMDAGKWKKICDTLESWAIKESPQPADELRESDYAMISAMNALISVLTDEQPALRHQLKNIFRNLRIRYQKGGKQQAAMVIHYLQEAVHDETLLVSAQEIKRLAQLPADQSAEDQI